MSKLGELVKESVNIYKSFLELEKEKYDVLLKDDYTKLDKILQEEQVYYLKLRGLEKKRETVMKELGLPNKDLKDIIDNEPEEIKKDYKLFQDMIKEFSEVHNLCKVIVDIRIRRVNNVIASMTHSDEQETDQTGVNIRI